MNRATSRSVSLAGRAEALPLADTTGGYRVVLVADFPPPNAGMPVQARVLRERLRREGIDVVAVRSNPRLPSRVAQWRFIRGAVRWILFAVACRKIVGADTVHVFACSGLSFVLFVLPPLLLGNLLGTPVLVHYHGGAAGEFARRHPKLLSWSLRRATRVVVPSGYLEQVFARLGVTCEVVANPAELDRFRFQDVTGRPPVLLCCRNLYPEYDVATTLRAFALLVQRVPQARLVVAGDGPDRARLEQLAESLAIAPAVEFLGNVAHERIPALLQRARLFVNSSRVDNQPVSILEAFATGVPVVSTRAGGIPWLVQDEVTGLLAPVGDVLGLAERMARVLENPELARHLAGNARRAVDAYAWEHIGPRWHALYRQASRRAA